VNVLVVGGTGFLGQHVVRESRRRGHAVTVLARRPGDGVVAADVNRLVVRDWADLLAGHDGVVFAAGADDRGSPPRRAAAYFAEHNVTPVRRMMQGAALAGCAGGVVLGSYFATMHRRWPELRLAERHPYVAARIEQMRAARAAGLPVAAIEVPFVVGVAPGRRSVFAPAVPLLGSRVPLAAPPGGTAVVSSRAIAEAAAGALERGAGGDYPVGEENLTWAELLSRLAEAAGRRPPVRIRRLPAGLFGAAVRAGGPVNRLRRREPGLSTAHLAELFTAELFLDPAVARDQLGVDVRGVDEALRAAVAADRAG
jgi:nucleoside-diphosphate-sugar epimerase